MSFGNAPSLVVSRSARRLPRAGVSRDQQVGEHRLEDRFLVLEQPVPKSAGSGGWRFDEPPVTHWWRTEHLASREQSDLWQHIGFAVGSIPMRLTSLPSHFSRRLSTSCFLGSGTVRRFLSALLNAISRSILRAGLAASSRRRLRAQTRAVAHPRRSLLMPMTGKVTASNTSSRTPCRPPRFASHSRRSFRLVRRRNASCQTWRRRARFSCSRWCRSRVRCSRD